MYDCQEAPRAHTHTHMLFKRLFLLGPPSPQIFIVSIIGRWIEGCRLTRRNGCFMHVSLHKRPAPWTISVSAIPLEIFLTRPASYGNPPDILSD